MLTYRFTQRKYAMLSRKGQGLYYHQQGSTIPQTLPDNLLYLTVIIRDKLYMLEEFRLNPKLAHALYQTTDIVTKDFA